MSALDLRRPGLWRLEAGQVHVFAEPRQGARRFLFTLPAPAVLFGLPEAPAGYGLCAVLAGGATLVPLPGGLAELATELAAPALVDGWITGWSEACVRELAGRPAPGRAAATGAFALADGALVEAGARVAWLRVESGSGVLYDSEPVGAGAVVPLGPGAWLRGFAPMAGEVLTTDAIGRSGLLADALAAAHALLQRQVATALSLASVDAAMRLDRLEARTAEEVSRASAELAGMVGFAPPQRSLPGANQTAFHAIHALARRMGLRAQLPPGQAAAEADTELPAGAVLRASGIRARRVRLPEDWTRRHLGDLLARDAQTGAPLALLDEPGGWRLFDPAQGTLVRLAADGAARIDAEAEVLHEPLPEGRLGLYQVALFGLRGTGRDMAVILLAAALAASLGALPALAAQLVVQELIPLQRVDLLVQAGLALAALALVRGVLSLAGNLAFARIRAVASARLKAAIWDRVLRQPLAALARFPGPDLAARCNTLEGIVAAMHQLVQQSVGTLMVLTANTVTLLWLSRLAGLAVLGLVMLHLGLLWLVWRAQLHAARQGEAAEGSVAVLVHALMHGIAKLRHAGAEDRAFARWAARFARSRARLIATRRVAIIYLAGIAGFDLACIAIVFALLATMPGDPASLGTLFGIVVAVGTILGSVAALGRSVIATAFQFASLAYCQPILDPAPPREARKADPGRLGGRIEVANLHFRHADGTAVLNGVSFAVRPGEFVAIVGATGSGKSTLIRLLLGLESALAGTVLFDGRDIAGLDLEAVRGQMGIVMQRARLLPGSLSEAIRGTSGADEAACWDAARLAGIDAEIAAMPMRMATLVGEGGQGLSGGQAQRLTLARALARRPAILVLDEATSALDTAAEARISANLAGLACTRIVVAHRLATVARADRVLVLDEGRIVEEGAPGALLMAGGPFARLMEGQHPPAARTENAP